MVKYFLIIFQKARKQAGNKESKNKYLLLLAYEKSIVYLYNMFNKQRKIMLAIKIKNRAGHPVWGYTLELCTPEFAMRSVFENVVTEGAQAFEDNDRDTVRLIDHFFGQGFCEENFIESEREVREYGDERLYFNWD